MLKTLTGLILLGCWIVFCLVWLISSLHVRAAKRTESVSSRAIHGIAVTVGGFLLTPFAHRGFLGIEIIRCQVVREIVGVSLVALGIGFAVQARRFLGENWSGRITLKEDHQLI